MTQQVTDPVTGYTAEVPDNWVLINGVSATLTNRMAEFISRTVSQPAATGQPQTLRQVVERLLLCGVRTELQAKGCTDTAIAQFTQAIVADTEIDWTWLEPTKPPSHPNSTQQLLLYERRRKQEKELADKRAKAEIEAKLERMVGPVLRIFDELRNLGVLLKCHGHNGTFPREHRPEDGGFIIPAGTSLRMERSRTVRCYLVGSNDGNTYRRALSIWPERTKDGKFAYIGTWGNGDSNDRHAFDENNFDSLRHWVATAVAAHEYAPPDVLDPTYREPPTEKPTRVISVDEAT